MQALLSELSGWAGGRVDMWDGLVIMTAFHRECKQGLRYGGWLWFGLSWDL